MRVRLKGIKKATSRGQVYYYAWTGGPRLKGEPGSPEFVESYNEAHSNTKQKRQTDTVGGLLAHYRGTEAYKGLSARSKEDYAPIFKMIETDFDGFPITAFSDRRTRGIFKAWRDQQAHTPRKADRMWSVLKRIINVAMDDGLVTLNPCDGGGKLHKGTRVECIWSKDQVELVKARGTQEIVAALVLAAQTGQRQADLLQLLWSNIDRDHIKLKQNKTGKNVRIKISNELRRMLDLIKHDQIESGKLSTHVLTNTRGKPWTTDGFQSSWGKAIKKIGIEGLQFNDLRGTAVTSWAEARATVPEIAALSGHSLKDVEKILEAHYLSMSQRLGDKVILRLDREQNDDI